MATKKPVIAVVGATGAQGSGLIRAILQDPEQRFTARAITRNPGSEKGRALSAQGVEVVAADAGDAASLDRAFAGATGVVLHHELLGALLARHRGHPGAEHGPRSRRGRT